MKLQILLVFLLAATPYSEETTLQYLKESLRRNHLMLKSQSLIIESKSAQAKSEGRLPNPFIKFGLFPKELSTKNGLTKSKLGVTQVLPPKSQLYFKKQIAIGSVGIEELKKEKTLQDLMLQLEKTFFKYNFLHQKKEVLSENFKLVNSWINLWKTHYSHHDFQYQRLIQLQVDAREIEDQIRSVKEQLPVVYEELRELAWLDEELLQTVKFDEEISNINDNLNLDNNIDLLIIDASKKIESSKLKFEHSFYKSKYILGSEWTMIDADGIGANQGNDAWMISVGMELVLDKNRVKNRVNSKKHMLQSLVRKRDYLNRHLKTQWSKSLFKLSDARLQYQLIKEDLVPRTREALDSIQANYITQSKGIDFFSLLGHLRKLLKLNLEMKNQYKNYFQAKAELKRILSTIGEN